MQVIESLVVEADEGLFEQLITPLQLQRSTEFDFPVYRLEINPELVILLYRSGGRYGLQPALLENILPHLRSLIVVARRGTFEEWEPPPPIDHYLPGLEQRSTVVLALHSGEDPSEEMPDYISQKGMWLGRHARLMFWREEDRESMEQIWRTAWAGLVAAE